MQQEKLDTLFSAMRQLPVEVAFERIEQLVRHQQTAANSIETVKKRGSGYNFIVIACITTISMAIIVSIYFLTGTPETVDDSTTIAPLTEEKVPGLSTHPLLPDTIMVKPDANMIVPLKSKPVISGSTQAVTTPEILTMATDTLVIRPPDINLPALQIDSIPAAETQMEDEAYTPLRVRTYTSSFCDFAGEDAWINAIVRALIKDKIITDTANLHFVISHNFFRVNGIKQESAVVNRYNKLYTSITGHQLNNDSRISLSVGESSCSLSKTIEE